MVACVFGVFLYAAGVLGWFDLMCVVVCCCVLCCVGWCCVVVC